MAFFSELNPAVPAGTDPASQGDDEIRAVKQSLQDQFPNFTAGPANPSLSELNALVGLNTSQSLETRLASLLDRVNLLPIPTSARNFLDSWWFQSGAEDQHRFYIDSATFDDYSNVPWPWGTQLPDQAARDRRIVLLIERYINNGQGIAFTRVTRIAEDENVPGSWGIFQFARGADNSTNMQNSFWWRNTAARIDTSVGNGGNILFTTVCPESATC